VNATTALPLLWVTVPIVGAPGTVAATNDADAAEAGLVPNVLVAVIVQVYVLAFVNADTVTGDVVPVPVFVTPKFDDVQVTSVAVSASPFVVTVNATIAEFVPRVTPVITGAAGAAAAVNDPVAAEADELPRSLVATAVHVYALAGVSEATEIGDDAPDAERVVPPSLEGHVTVKPLMAWPPVPFAVNATLTVPLPRVAAPIVGAAGTVPATNELVAADATLVPSVLVAVAVHVYVFAFVSVATVTGEDAPDPVLVVPPSLEVHVTVKLVTVSLPSVPGVNATPTEFGLAGVAAPIVGAFGFVAATKELESDDSRLSPMALVACTVQMYVLPFVKPETVTGDEPCEPVASAPPSLDAHDAV
jgi:hypothetical protein